MGLWPLCFLLFTIISLEHEDNSASAVNILGQEKNVGTVLFDKSDSTSHCWTNEEFIILNSRKVFEDLLPTIETLNIQNDQYIADLLRYFQTCFEHVDKLAVGKTKHLMLESLADTMGGYLHSYAMPITKVSFYAGDVKYCNIKKMYGLLGELKDFLQTNGAGWTRPMKPEMFINVTPIAISVQDAEAACNQLIVNPAMIHRRKRNYRQRRRRLKRKRFALGDLSSKENLDNSVNYQHQKDPFIFLPYLDNDLVPNSIALPFKDHTLWSLYDKESVSVLLKYYDTCVSCISSKENHKQLLDDFNKNFYQWLLQSVRAVYPRLNDEKWYPAFGGVLKIITYLKILVESDEKMNHYEVIPTTTKIIDVVPLKTSDAEIVEPGSLGTTELIFIAVSSAVLVWILVGLVLVCYRYLRKHPHECSPCESPNSEVMTLYKNKDYCVPNTCPALNPQKSVGEKVKDWWKEKFKTCPGGCNKTCANEQYIATYNYNSKGSVYTNGSRRSYKKRKKKVKPVSCTASPSSSPCSHYNNKKFHYSSDITSSCSDSSYR